MRSPSPTPLAQIVIAHGKGLASIRSLLEDAASQAVDVYRKAWGRFPKGTVLSGMTRDRFLELTDDSTELAGSGVVVRSCGEDWVRILLKGPGWEIALRTRPTLIHVDEGSGGLFGLDEYSAPLGTPVLFWRFDREENQLASFAMARVVDMTWVMEAKVYEEVEITYDLASLAPLPSPPGASNDDDNLDDVVGRWDNDEPQSEAEATDKTDEDSDDDEPGTTLGENRN